MQAMPVRNVCDSLYIYRSNPEKEVFEMAMRGNAQDSQFEKHHKPT